MTTNNAEQNSAPTLPTYDRNIEHVRATLATTTSLPIALMIANGTAVFKVDCYIEAGLTPESPPICEFSIYFEPEPDDS